MKNSFEKAKIDSSSAKSELDIAILNSTFQIGEKIGAGAFGKVYSAVNIHTQEEVAIKVEDAQVQQPKLLHEVKMIKLLHRDQTQRVEGIPKVILSTFDSQYNTIVMERLGNNLERQFNRCGRRFSLKTVLMLADQLLSRIEYIHSKEIIHRDLKPENCLIGQDQQTIYIVDFGLARRYIKDGDHIECSYENDLIGTARYASIYNHKGYSQSRRDDLESIGYMLIYFLTGHLPWQDLGGKNQLEKYRKIGDKKCQTSIAALCKNIPKEFADYLKYVRGLKFEKTPDYNHLRGLFKKVFEREGYTQDLKFDWMVSSKETGRSASDVSTEIRETRINSRETFEDRIVGIHGLLGPVQLPIRTFEKNQKCEGQKKSWFPIFNCFA